MPFLSRISLPVFSNVLILLCTDLWFGNSDFRTAESMGMFPISASDIICVASFEGKYSKNLNRYYSRTKLSVRGIAMCQKSSFF